MMEMVKSTWDLAREAIKSGRTDEALELISSGCAVGKTIHDSAYSFVGLVLNCLARFGEEEIEKVCRERYTPMVKDWISTTPGAKESLYKMVEAHRGHYSEFTITEEPDRYVLRLDPCGSGGRLLRRGMSVGELKVAGMSIGTTKKAYPWCWSKSGVSYYCVHSCLICEVIPIELRGYPIAVVEYPDKPEDPCFNLFYKKPELIPEEYFTRVGKTKTIK